MCNLHSTWTWEISITPQSLHCRGSGWCPLTRVWVVSKDGRMFWIREKCLLSAGTQTTIPWLPSLQPIHYTWLCHLSSHMPSLSLWNSVYNSKVPHTHTCCSCIIVNDREKIADNKKQHFLPNQRSVFYQYFTLYNIFKYRREIY